MDLLKDMLHAWPGRVTLTLIALIVALTLAVIYGSVQEQRAWEAFADEHDCKVVGRISSTTSTGVGLGISTSGNAVPVVTTSTTPAKTGYACNDGVTYWR